MTRETALLVHAGFEALAYALGLRLFLRLRASRPSVVVPGPRGTRVLTGAVLGALFFGWLRARHGSLLPSILAHGLHNALVAAVGRDGRLVGAIGFSRPRVVMQYRRLIAEGAGWDEVLELAASS